MTYTQRIQAQVGVCERGVVSSLWTSHTEN